MRNGDYRRNEYSTEVNGKTIPTMKYTLEQIGRLGQRIDGATSIASAALLMTAVELIAIVSLAITILR